ncbi:ionotropic receptor 75a-like [Teleopsis dalmanni]|uniref:ionotropic receptor 75a-like n=1 Tax=Teleopsis dalmanni TaxID=139649 RepID=UPI0018CF990B|nr:ionotropic receptor 75a-like [Teleopsis dalmanni]
MEVDWPHAQDSWNQVTREADNRVRFRGIKRNLRNDFTIRVLQLNRPILGIFLDKNCENSEYILNMTSRQLLFTEHLHWLLYDNNGNLSYFKELFEKVNLFANADVTFIVPNKERTNIQNTSYIIYDVYNNGRPLGGKLNITLDHEVICNNTNCQLGQYYSKLHLRSKYGNRNTLKDVTLRIAVVANKFPITAPEKEIQQFLISENKPYVDSIARFGYHRLLILQDVLKFKMNLTYHDRWSKTDAVGGSVGDLGTERVELTSTPFLPTAARFENLTAITEAADFHMICMFRTPRNAGIQGDVFLAPFSMTVWCVFGIILFISGIFLWAIFYLENHRLKKCLNYVPCLLTACLISFGSACSQGSFLLPRSTGGRMAFFSLSLISFFMYNYYTSIIVSTLLGSPIKSHIKTMGQLADSNLEVAMEPLPYTASYLYTSKLPDVRRFVARKVEPQKNNPKLWLSVEEGVKLMRDNPGFVYVFTAATGYELVEKFFKPHEICDTNEVLFRPEKYLYSHTHKNSTYKELIRLT